MTNEIQYAAWDAMQEAASSLKAELFKRSLETDIPVQIDYWENQQDLIDKATEQVDATNLTAIREMTSFLVQRLHDYQSSMSAA